MVAAWVSTATPPLRLAQRVPVRIAHAPPDLLVTACMRTRDTADTADTSSVILPRQEEVSAVSRVSWFRRNTLSGAPFISRKMCQQCPQCQARTKSHNVERTRAFDSSATLPVCPPRDITARMPKSVRSPRRMLSIGWIPPSNVHPTAQPAPGVGQESRSSGRRAAPDCRSCGRAPVQPPADAADEPRPPNP